ncbi:MAG: substrate-binding domain-containing protein [Spirochaetaceae bacterium]|nr:substrate-binding domain-containing protein [Spirochaetaceae bacterium]
MRLRLAGKVDGMRKSGINISEDQIQFIEMGGGGSDTTPVANQKMTDWLTAHPDFHKIAVGTVNTETGQGVFSAVQAAGRDSDVYLATNNNGNQTLAAWEQGDNMWLGGSAYYPTKYGEYIIPMALDILAGKDVPRIMTMEHKFLTRDDIGEVKAEMGIE